MGDEIFQKYNSNLAPTELLLGKTIAVYQEISHLPESSLKIGFVTIA